MTGRQTREPFAFATIAEMRAALQARTVTPCALAQAALARAERLNPASRAFIEITRQRAEAEAKALEVSRVEGPLAGIPYAAKDLFDVAGANTTAGSRVLADNRAETDATAIACLSAAGAVCLGKLNLHEFAYGATGENPIHGTPPNAYDPTRLAGGSSSGSAAAVAFGIVPFALGTDTGGSVRAPAALSGLVGLKPTLGRVSLHGVIPYAWTLDHAGIIARTVADAAEVLSAIAGHDPADAGSAREPVEAYAAAAAARQDLAGVTIGVPRRFFFEHADPEILAATEAVLMGLESRGARLCDVVLPDMEHARTVSLTIQMPEALSYHMPMLETRGELYGADFRAGLALGQCLLAEHYVRAKRMLTRYRQETDAVLETVDLLLTPAAPAIAPRIRTSHVETAGRAEPAGNAITRYTTFFNMSGHPAITVPSGLHSAGLPMGVQLIGRHFEEAALLRAAMVAERAAPLSLPLPRVD